MKNKNEKAESNLKNIFAAAKAENSESSNLESVKPSNLETETLVNLGVKIPAAHRNFWNSKAAAAGLSMKSIIVSALTEKLGKPE
jgi:Holliday junction resolvasome RuvABC DNA-binding subunit